MKEELKNAIVEMNLQGIITDEELISISKRLNKHFADSSASVESRTLDNNQEIKEVCVAESFKEFRCEWEDIECKNCDMFKKQTD